ncbi:uncharacterized protein LOC119681830 [Teleopsis dalmanni]|uniref:uncharacterized protein LOC119680585 n=2 Tax=Teleopsis dalmanni TaxID=139649 RepID=UPI0018CDFD22|nr:uncharacterized protein LOC119680585 [Teleopsis dalmanni]XP_037951049.1 uncharacterized protein LOC119681830 [Teleopsis dalmanni]
MDIQNKSAITDSAELQLKKVEEVNSKADKINDEQNDHIPLNTTEIKSSNTRKMSPIKDHISADKTLKKDTSKEIKTIENDTEVLKGENKIKNKSAENAKDLLPVTKKSPSPTTQSQTPPQAEAANSIPDNILSPPKSETQTDETNTATSSSPASDSQLSPEVVPEIKPKTNSSQASPRNTDNSEAPISTKNLGRVVQPINIVANGTIPKSGKPLMASINKKINKSSRSTRPRKQKVPIYESEISDNKVGIKLCIKKSDATVTATAPTPPTSSKQIRKRSRKSKSRHRVDSDDSEYETKRKKDRNPNNNNERQKKVSFSGVKAEEASEPIEQSIWGSKIPEDVLYQIFEKAVEKEGSLPTLCRLGRVCALWRRVSVRPTLWKVLDLTTWFKEKSRTELRLKWVVDNRCSSCTDLNISNWKVTDINCFLHKLAAGCTNLTGITLAGWKGFTCDHLAFLVNNMKKLERIDLSSVNVEMNASKSAVGLQSLCTALQTMNKRLTHLYLAHNRLAGIPQIVNILSDHCANLVLLDLSNVTTQATSHGILRIEKLQHGCKKLKVLRVTNSQITPSTATMQEMMDSPGFPNLEELSIAALTDESRVIGDEHLQRILKTSSKLKLLDVRGCARLTHESLIRLPAWDIKHLFLSGCSVTRDNCSGLELIASKWAHSLIELDLAWANVQQPLDNALRALAEKGSESPLAHLNLCGSSVSEEAVKEILSNCAYMSSINLSSCRGLPRGVKRLMQGQHEIKELRDVLKVQMKVKLPSQLKKETESSEDTKLKLNNSTEDVEKRDGILDSGNSHN